jgi:hypothetical protein
MGETGRSYKIFFKKPEKERGSMGDTDVHGGIMLKLIIQK